MFNTHEKRRREIAAQYRRQIKARPFYALTGLFNINELEPKDVVKAKRQVPGKRIDYLLVQLGCPVDYIPGQDD